MRFEDVLRDLGFTDVEAVEPNLFRARKDGRVVWVLVKVREGPGGFTLRESRLRRLRKLGEVYVLLLERRLLGLEEAVKKKVLRVFGKPRSVSARGRGGRVRVSLSLGEDTLEAVDRARGDMSRSRFVERTLRLWLGLDSLLEVEVGGG